MLRHGGIRERGRAATAWCTALLAVCAVSISLPAAARAELPTAGSSFFMPAFSGLSAGTTWGWDTASFVDSGFLSGARSRYGANPTFVGRYLDTAGQFSPMGASEAQFIRSQGIQILLVADYGHNSSVGYANGHAYGARAVSEAQALHVPAGVAIFHDTETSDAIDAGFVEGWYDAVTGGSYRAGFYENPDNGGFSGAYCAAVAHSSAYSNMVLYSSEPDYQNSIRDARTGPAGAPAWAPDSPPCTSHTVAWQYAVRGNYGPPNVDTDEALASAPFWGGTVGPTPAGFTSNLLSSASFEGGQVAGWNLQPGANWAAYHDGSAHDGRYFLETNSGGLGGGGKASIWQDVSVSTTPGQSYSFSAWLRARAPATVCLALWGLGGTQEGGGAQQTCPTLTTRWQRITVPLDTHVSAHTKLRAQIYLETPGVNVDLDGASLIETGLASASFENGSTSGWNRTPGANWAAYHDGTAQAGQYYLETNTGSLGGGGAASLWQDVPVSATTGQSYAFSAWLRARSPATVCLVLWGLGGTQEGGGDQQTCPTLGSSWQLVTVPLDIHRSAHGTLRAQLYLETPNVNIDIDGTQLVQTGLGSASFEDGSTSGWNFTSGMNRATYHDGSAHDGQYFLEMNSGSLGGSGATSLWQDVPVTSSPGQSFTFSAWLRARAPAGVCVVLWGLGGTQEGGADQQACTTLGTGWQMVTVPLDTHASGHSTLRAQIYLETAGVNVDMDGATLAAAGAQPSVPGTPTAIHARGGNAYAAVSWTAPSDTGGEPLNGYQVTASPGGATSTVPASRHTAIVHVHDGVSYTFTVTALGAGGPGEASAPSNRVTPRGPAPPPRRLHVRVTRVKPSHVRRGHRWRLTLSGRDFRRHAHVRFSRRDIWVLSVRWISARTFVVWIRVGAHTKTGRVNVTLTDPGGARGTCRGCLRILR